MTENSENTDKIAIDYDFDHLKNLAEQDPEEFERQRILLIARNCFDTAASQKNKNRLKGLQFQVDGIILLSNTPMESCLAVSALMHKEGLGKLQDALNGHLPHPENNPLAPVIPFSGRNHE